MKSLVRMGSEFVVTCGLLLFGTIKLCTKLISYVTRGIHAATKWIDSHPDKVIESMVKLDIKVHNWALGPENKDKESGKNHVE